MFNVVDCPSIVKVNAANTKMGLNSTVYNIEDYCNKSKIIGEERFFAEKCASDKNYKCLDDIFPEVPCVFDNNKNATDYFIKRFNKKYSKDFNKNITEEYYDTAEEVNLTIKKMIEYQNKISAIKDLPIPPVDIDIVYSSFNPTLSAEFLNKDNLEVINKEKGGEVYKGGDGTVPTWSPLLTAFKWIYEKKKNNLTQNIRLVQYCSRLALINDDNLKNIKGFKAISCSCLDEKGQYKNDLDKCGHQNMLNDKELYNYIFGELNIESTTEIEDQIKKAVTNYKTDRDYMGECTQRLIGLNINYKKVPCNLDYEITKEQYEEGAYCDKQNLQTSHGYSCCSYGLKGIDESGESHEGYGCIPMKTDYFYKIFMKYFISSLDVYDELNIQSIDFDCAKENNTSLAIVILIPSVLFVALIVVVIILCIKARNLKK